MKIKRYRLASTIRIAALGVFLTMVVACGGHSHSHEHGHDHSHDAKTEQSEKGKEYTSKYICPMHCDGSGSAEAGKCPVCGMDYVLNEDFKEE